MNNQIYQIDLKDANNTIFVITDKQIENLKYKAQIFLMDLVKKKTFYKYLTEKKINSILNNKKGQRKDFNFLSFNEIKDFNNLKKLIRFSMLISKAQTSKQKFISKGLEYLPK